jgi:nucleotide-binding universal stress UspA family protein
MIMTRFNKILVPIDYSTHSEEAIRTAVDLAKRYSAPITLVNVYEPIDRLMPEAYWFLTPDQEARVLAAFKERLEKTEKQLHDMGAKDVASQLLEGPIAPKIVDYARDRGFDLIVMGTHGRTGVKHFVLGSVAERVLRIAPCAVLVVKAPEASA